MNLEEIVMRLIGPVQPLGDHGKDQERLKNMRMLTNLTDALLGQIIIASRDATRQEESMRAIGKFAEQFLLDTSDRLREIGIGDS